MEYLYSREYILMRASKPDWMEGKKLRKYFFIYNKIMFNI